MSNPAGEIADFIHKFVKQQENSQGASLLLTDEKGYQSIESGAGHHFIVNLVIDLGDKTVQMDITKGPLAR